MIAIRHRDTGAVLLELDLSTLRGASLRGANLTGANLSRADLTSADLTRANLIGANLNDANLNGANLIGANLNGTNLTRASLRDTNLSDANLRGASLRGANLSRADLTGASLRGTNLIGANLSDANLTRASLRGANLTLIRADLRHVLASARAEVPALLEALRSGLINGAVYEGKCSCLVGTIATARGCSYRDLVPNSARPAERWFLALSPGDTPATSQVAAITEGWIVEWLAEVAQ